MSHAIVEPLFETVWPLGRKAYAGRELQDRVADLSGKVIGELWDYLFRGEEIFPILREELRARYPGVQFVTYDVFGNVHGPEQLALVAKIPERLAHHKVDAVISAIGA